MKVVSLLLLPLLLLPLLLGPIAALDESAFDARQLACLAKRQFLVEGECRTLGERPPCAQGELLLLDDSADEPTPACKPKRCNGTEVWWAATGRCRSRSKAKSESCRSDQEVRVDVFGDASCACGDGRASVKGRCFDCYRRGPCREGETVTVTAARDGAGVCSRDLCAAKNRGLPDAEWAPLEGKGGCHRLGSAGPCAKLSAQSRFVVDPAALVPRCSDRDLVLHVIDAALLCRIDDKGECREEVEVQREDRTAYWARIKRDLARKKNQGRNKP